MSGKGKKKVNPYQVLGLENCSSTRDVKKRYKRLALKLHPDMRPENPRSAELFDLTTEAYHFLLDPDKKREFDLELERSKKKEYHLKHKAVRRLRKKQRGGIYSRKNISDQEYNEFIDECKDNFMEFFSKVERLK